MPFGPSPAGFGYFAGIKAAGYTAAAVGFKRGYKSAAHGPTVWGAGLTRTAIGLVVGLLYGTIWFFGLGKLFSDEVGGVVYYVLLLPVRLAEWVFLIWLLFDRGLHDRARMWKFAAFGTACSYALDAIGVAAAFVLPGGIWVC